MIDTLALRSPYLEEKDAQALEFQLFTRLGIINKTLEVQYEITTGQIRGSYEHTVALCLKRDQFLALPPKEEKQPALVTKIATPPYITVEGSVHKALLGHNCFGGPRDPEASCRWFVDHLRKATGVNLPDASEWTVTRIDWAECFDMGSPEACEDFIRSMAMASYPRRGEPSRFKNETVFWKGSHTTEKVYWKGPEYRRHDFKRLCEHLGAKQAIMIRDMAQRIVRAETTIRAKKLKADFLEAPKPGQLTEAYLETVWAKNFGRIIREGKEDMQTVRDTIDVARRLHHVYAPALANSLYAMWLQLATLPGTEVRKIHPKSSYYRKLQQLRNAGISWHDTDIIIEGSTVPRDFLMTLDDRRRIDAVAPEVHRQLAA